jgi:hypothetical protein
MLDEIYDAVKDSDPADRYQIKRYIAWLQFRRRTHDQFYLPAHWVYAKKAPPQLEEPKPLFDTFAGNAHWI